MSVTEPEAVARQELSTEDLFNMVVDSEIGIAPEQPQDAVAETETPQETAFDLDPEIPEDILSFLAEDDEPVAEAVEPTFEEDEFEYDEEKKALKKQLEKLEAKARWAEEQRLKAVRPKWEEEAAKFFPLADTDSIDADSRRGFLKQAKEQHERNKEIFGKRGVQAAEQILAKAREEAEQIKAQAKAEAEQAWGNPGVNLSPQAPSNAPSAETYDEAFRRGGLAAAIRATFQS